MEALANPPTEEAPIPSSTTPTEPEEACATLEPLRRSDNTIDWSATRGKYQSAYKDAPRDPLTEAPAWQVAYNQLWAQEQERHIHERIAEIDRAAKGIEAPLVDPYVPLVDLGAWAQAAQGTDALIFDEELARSSPCTRLALGPDVFLYYSRGMSGALSPQQVSVYCATFDDQTATASQRTRLSVLVEAAPYCRINVAGSIPDKKLGDFYTCLGKELRKKGVDP